MAEPGPCLSCGQPRGERDRYCEHCGLDEDTAASWELELVVDRDQFARVGAPGLVCPDGRAPVIVPLAEDEVLVGRDRHGGPDVNLDGGWLDPGVSRHHCTFERQHDGGYGVRDAGSTNGTTINVDPTPISPFTLVRLDDGDRVHVGAWTVLHYRRVASGS